MKMKRIYVKLGLQIFLLQPELIGSEFIETAGFMEVADSNDMVIIFPSTIARALIILGCAETLNPKQLNQLNQKRLFLLTIRNGMNV